MTTWPRTPPGTAGKLHLDIESAGREASWYMLEELGFGDAAVPGAAA